MVQVIDSDNDGTVDIVEWAFVLDPNDYEITIGECIAHKYPNGRTKQVIANGWVYTYPEQDDSQYYFKDIQKIARELNNAR